MYRSKYARCAAMVAVALFISSTTTLAATSTEETKALQTWKGRVQVTTPGDGLWTFVSVAASDASRPLQVGFNLQCEKGRCAPPDFAEIGTVEQFGSNLHPELALQISLPGQCLYFRVQTYAMTAPSTCATFGLVGIARYDALPGGKQLPTSHDEFVKAVLAVHESEGPKRDASGALDGCGGCTSGGQGLASAVAHPHTVPARRRQGGRGAVPWTAL